MKWLCALLPVAWLQGVAYARVLRALGDKSAPPTSPAIHVGNDDDEYYLEDTGEKEYYYYDQDEYYEYFQDRKPIASLRNRRMEKAIRKLRRLAQAASVQGCNETELVNARNLCERKITLAKKIRSTGPSNKKMRSMHRKKVCRLVTEYADCISAIAPNGDCPDIAFKLKTDAQRSVHIEGFQVCRSSGTEPVVWLLLVAVYFYIYFQKLWPK
ncbi:uncharacterized protein LOC142776966 [Rhipicephalus microplus]|uniref:uncharacterized protein LOC142776966 n=1 Tax=Rhipicephalus microplus TaxID=6941 RepID=UPI003F6BB2D6